MSEATLSLSTASLSSSSSSLLPPVRSTTRFTQLFCTMRRSSRRTATGFYRRHRCVAPYCTLRKKQTALSATPLPTPPSQTQLILEPPPPSPPPSFACRIDDDFSPDRINDCLSELDAYLEEADQESASAEARHRHADTFPRSKRLLCTSTHPKRSSDSLCMAATPGCSSAAVSERRPLTHRLSMRKTCPILLPILPTTRQLGRRSDPRPRLIAIANDRDADGTRVIRLSHAATAPSTTADDTVTTSAHQSDDSTDNSELSRNQSPVSLAYESTASSSSVSDCINATPPRHSDAMLSTISDSDDRSWSKDVQWPHNFSRAIALTACTLGVFNISRFAVLSVHFGGTFVLQFLLLSAVFGVPMLWLLICLGNRLRSGPVALWRISPICAGIGVALLVAQALAGLYLAVSISWLLVYFRDAFVTRLSKYRWQEAYTAYRTPFNEFSNGTLSDGVVSYFNGVVLQRLRYTAPPNDQKSVSTEIGSVRFQLAFNLAVVWTITFLVHSRGIRSFGKIVLGLVPLAACALLVVTAKLLAVARPRSIADLFAATDWHNFIMNSNSWSCAFQETFLTWFVFGSSVLSISGHSLPGAATHANRRFKLRRDALLAMLATIVGLLLAGLFGNACHLILLKNGYYYYPASYESAVSNVILYARNEPLPPHLVSVPSYLLPRYATLLGESFRRPGINGARESGFQAFRLATELFPAALGAATKITIAPIWSLIGFFALLLFAIVQLAAIWQPIGTVFGNTPSSVLLTCVFAILCGIPFTTDIGVRLMHFVDFVIGGAWWIPLLWAAALLAIFLIRGRPLTSDSLVNDLNLTQTLAAFVAFAWNVLLPVGLIMLCIVEYRSSGSRMLFRWRSPGATYWPTWTRKCGATVQVCFLLAVPLAAFIQIYRYLTRGPVDILDRIQLLCRPPLDPVSTALIVRPTEIRSQSLAARNALAARDNDNPPKYTPPPSYTTATGARIAKALRRTIRRSVRRFIRETTTSSSSSPSPLPHTVPPAYSSAGHDIARPSINPQIPYESLTGHDVAQLLRTATVTPFQRATSLNASVDSALRRSNTAAARFLTAAELGGGGGGSGSGFQSHSLETLVLHEMPTDQRQHSRSGGLHHDNNVSVI